MASIVAPPGGGGIDIMQLMQKAGGAGQGGGMPPVTPMPPGSMGPTPSPGLPPDAPPTPPPSASNPFGTGMMGGEAGTMEEEEQAGQSDFIRVLLGALAPGVLGQGGQMPDFKMYGMGNQMPGAGNASPFVDALQGSLGLGGQSSRPLFF